MRNRIIEKITALVCAMALLVSITGCAGNDGGTTDSVPEKAAVCFVIANTACSQGLNLNSPLVQDTAYNTIRNYGYISVVNVDGTPELVFDKSYDIGKQYKSASKEKLDMEARNNTANLISIMQGVVADDPETDYLSALRLASRSMSSLDGYDSKSIIVLGTGLGTAGILDFRNNLLSAEPSAVVDILREKEDVPDFSNMTVYWQQMGDVAAPQQSLTSIQRNRLQDIYGGIIEAGGGAFVYNDILPYPVNENAEYPDVTPVELPADIPMKFDQEVIETEETEEILAEPWVLYEEQVAFVGDKWEYFDPDKAVNALKPLAELLADTDTNILLCGTTAGDEDTDFSITLSQNRAETVKNTLCELGVDASRITVIGLGCHDPWHVRGLGYSDAASCNRKVVIVNAESDVAKSILEQ